MKLQQLIPAERIRLDITAKSAEDVIKALVKMLVENGDLEDGKSVEKMIIERERQVGTGIGYGVAIPHSEPGPFKKPLAAFMRLSKPVDFCAPDNQKVRLVFLLLTPDETPALHVRLLARICRLTRSQKLRDLLLEASTPEDVARNIAELETDYPELTP